MDPRNIKDQDQRDRLEALPDMSLLRAGMVMAGIHPFAMGEDGTLDLINPSELATSLYVPADQLGLSQAQWHARLSPSDQRARQKAIRTLTWDGARYSLDYKVKTGQNNRIVLREIAEAIAVADGRATLIHGVLIDRTAEAAQLEQAAWAVRHDEETGLDSETALRDIAGHMIELAGSLETKASLIRLRVTNFDQLTQVYGPEVRAALLDHCQRALSQIVARPNVLSRLDNGDWGVVLFSAEAQSLQDRMGQALTDTSVKSRFGPLDLMIEAAHMPINSGLNNSGADRMSTVLERLKASLDGVSAAKDVQTKSSPKFDVLKALSEDQISLAFQPIVHASSGALAHHECLLRLRQVDGQVISAGPLVMQAERDGLVDQLDRRALALAIPHLEAHPELHLALNVSAATVTDKTIAQDYLAALKDLGALAGCLTIEMTETLAVDDPQQAADFAKAVKDLGCRFSIDDFGAGYTTFRNLMAIDADSVKIDGSLIAGISTDANKQTFMRMMVDLAETVGVKTVAEMVETKADADMLCRLGVDYLQGYYFGHPSAAPVWSRLGR